MSDTIKDDILDDSKLDGLLRFQENLRVITEMAGNAAAGRVSELAGLRGRDRLEQLSSIYKCLLSAVDQCRHMMAFEIQKADEPAVGSDSQIEAFNPMSVKDSDLKWFVSAITVHWKNGVIKISLPLLLPHRHQILRDRYIDTLIWIGIMQYVKNNPVVHIASESVLIAFCHIYDHKNLGRIKDHDNIEVKQCIDRIAQYFIQSDAGMNCQLFHKSELGDSCRTDIYIMDDEVARDHLFDVFQWDFDG